MRCCQGDCQEGGPWSASAWCCELRLGWIRGQFFQGALRGGNLYPRQFQLPAWQDVHSHCGWMHLQQAHWGVLCCLNAVLAGKWACLCPTAT